MRALLVALLLCLVSAPFVMAAPTGGSGAECATCQLVFTYVESMLNSQAGEAEVEAALDKVCAFLPAAFNATCVSIINMETEKVIQWILANEPPTTICTQLLLCANSTEAAAPAAAPVVVPAAPASDAFCSVCELVFTYVENMLASNSSEYEIEQALDAACDILPSALQPECQSLIANYLPELVQLLEQEASPATICAAVGVCANSSYVIVPEEEKPAAADGAFCSVCELVFTYVESVLSSNATDYEIEKVLGDVCNILPSGLRPECSSLIQSYLPELISLLLNKESPATICAAIHVCDDAAAAAAAPAAVLVPAAAAVAAPEDGFCSVCELVFTYVESVLSSNASESDIEKVLDDACNILPGSLRSECQALISSYLPELVEMLLNKESPAAICAAVHVCDNSTAAVVAAAVVVEQPQSDAFCSVCELVFTYVENVLASNASEYEIEKVLDDVCNILPSSLRSECQALIQSYLPELVQMLLNKESPAAICAAVHVCDNSTATATTAAVAAPQGLFCIACEYAVQAADGFLTQQSTETEIVTIVENVCKLAPTNVQPVCDAMISTYGPEIINLLVAKATPDAVCTLAGACAANSSLLAQAQAGELCSLCEFAFSSLESWLAEAQSQQDLEAFVDRLCALLPNNAAKCQVMVAAFLPMVVQFIESNVSPTAACAAVKLC